jgi:hypothetical protein
LRNSLQSLSKDGVRYDQAKTPRVDLGASVFGIIAIAAAVFFQL